MALSAEDAATVANATCSRGSSPFSDSGEWNFFPDGAAVWRPPCHVPFAPNSLAVPKSNPYAGDDFFSCDTTYAQLVYPHHLVACIVYGAMSLFFAVIYYRFAMIVDKSRTPAMRATGTTKPMQKVYGLCCLASTVSLMSCVDIKGWAGIFSLPVQQFFVELSVGLVHCALFILTSMWISMSQKRGSRKLNRWLTLGQYACGVAATLGGCLLGVLEWSLSASPSHGSKNGSLSAAKHLCLALFEVLYVGAGTIAALHLIRRLSKSGSGVANPPGKGPAGDRIRTMTLNQGAEKVAQLRQAARAIGRSLAVVVFLCALLVVYRVNKAISSFGQTSYRYPPCEGWPATYILFSQMTIIGSLGCFALVGAPASKTDANESSRPTARFGRRMSFWPGSFMSKPVPKSSNMEAEEAWKNATPVPQRIGSDSFFGRLTRSFSSASPNTTNNAVENNTELVSIMENPIKKNGMLAATPVVPSPADSDQSNVLGGSVKRGSIWSGDDSVTSVWMDWDASEPTLFEELERNNGKKHDFHIDIFSR